MRCNLISSIRRITFGLVTIVSLAAVVSLAACGSSAPPTVADGEAREAGLADRAAPPDDGSPFVPDTSPPDAAPPDGPSQRDAAQDAQDAGPCGSQALASVRILSLLGPLDTVTVRMVDECQGTSAPVVYPGGATSSIRFRPTVGAKHYFVIDPMDPTKFYKAASEAWNYPDPRVTNDVRQNIVPKPGSGVPDVFGANYDAAKAHFVVRLLRFDSACEVSGYTLSVAGHPEAVIQYGLGGGYEIDSTATATSGTRQSFAFISKVDPDVNLVEIVGTKPGCKLFSGLLRLPVQIYLNRFPLLADTVTFAELDTYVQ